MNQSATNGRRKRILVVLLATILVGAGILVYAVLKRPNDQLRVAVTQSTSSTSKKPIQTGQRQSVSESRTPSGHDKPNEVKSSQSEPNHKPETKHDSNSNQQPSPKPNTGHNTQPNQPTPQSQPSSNNPTPAPQPQPQPPQPQPPVDHNDVLRKQIESRYGVKVKYGQETVGYHPRGVTTTPLDEAKVPNALEDLNTALSRYPAGFFQEFRANGMPLTFYLVYSAGGIFTGFFDRQFMNDLKVTLVRSDLLFILTTHHELMHAIDSFMEIKMYPREPYSEYTALNPADFKYKTDNIHANFPGYVHNLDNKANAYFTTSYGQTSPREDKAEVFKFMMRDRDSLGMFSNTPHIKAKARVIARQIEANFTTANSSAYWNRFLK